jgi:hypothetical protein
MMVLEQKGRRMGGLFAGTQFSERVQVWEKGSGFVVPRRIILFSVVALSAR